MKIKPTPPEIAAEIAALRALRPVGRFARQTAATIAVQIDTLSGEIDDTAAEFDELSEHEQDAARYCLRWLDGENTQPPSQGWGALCS